MPITQTMVFSATPPTTGETPTTFNANAISCWVDLKDNIVPDLNTAFGQMNTLETNVNAKEANVIAKEASTVTNALSAQGSANYQGLWLSQGYTVGQTVSDANGIRWLCKLTHVTAQTPIEGTYWTIAIPYIGAIGNINSPLLDMPMLNSLAMKSGVGSATFTRASTATYIDRYGVLKTAAIDEPRFEKEGYLNEGASTNLILQSSDAATTWGSSGATVTLNTAETTAPDETTTSDILLETATTALHFNSQVYAGFTAGTIYTFSRFVKAKGRTKCAFSLQGISFGVTQSSSFDLTAKTATTTAGTATCKIEELANGWFRCSITATATITASSQAQHFILDDTGASTYLGDITKGLYVFGGQLEALPFASSYIPTTTAAVTRSADVEKNTRYDNAPSIVGDFTVLIDAKSLIGGISSANRMLLSIGTIAGLQVYHQGASGAFLIYYNSTAIMSSVLYTLTSKTRIGITKSGTTMKVYIDGILKSTVTVTNAIDITDTTFQVGCSNGFAGQFYGSLSNIRIHDKALTAQEVALA